MNTQIEDNIKNIGLFYGGRSFEHEISCTSANFVYKKLENSIYKIISIYISKSSELFLQDIPYYPNDSKVKAETKISLIFENKKLYLQTQKHKISIDFIFPILHGIYGEDGSIQGLAEFYNIPYAGCGLLSSAICMDKKQMKNTFSHTKLLQTKFREILFYEWNKDPDKIYSKIKEELKFPIFVKPCNTGSSIGISKVSSINQLDSAIKDAFAIDPFHIILEEAVDNPIELEVSILGSLGNYKVSEVGKCKVPSNSFYSFDEKYGLQSVAKLEIPAILSKELKRIILKQSIEAFTSVGGYGFARVDFLFSNSTKLLYINEINTIPGFTSISMFPKLWEIINISIEDLLNEIITLGIFRQQKNIK